MCANVRARRFPRIRSGSDWSYDVRFCLWTWLDDV